MSGFSKIAVTSIGEVAAGTLTQVTPETSLFVAITAMRDHRSGAVLVVDDTGIAGIFTERDLLKRIDHRDLSWHSKQVREVMTPNPKTIGTHQTIEDALNLMTVGSFRRLPLVDANGKPVAIVSIRDILKHMVELYPQEFVNLPPDPSREASRRYGG